MLPLLLIVGSMYGYRAPLANKVDPRCYKKETVRAWVYFTDKGVKVEEFERAITATRARMAKAVLQRRALRQGVIAYEDLPVNQDYISEVEANGGLLIRRSKWVNAASFIIAREDLERIAGLPFVHKIVPVAFHRGITETEVAIQDTAIYGLAYRQIKMFNIDKVHEKGIYGSNIRVGFLDTGLRKIHSSLRNIKLIAEYDFLSGDRLFLENMPIIENPGVYSRVEFHKTVSKLHIFAIGDTSVPGPSRNILYTYSTDGGSTWQEPMERLTNSTWVAELSICGRDTIFLFYCDNSGLKYLVLYETSILSQGILHPGFSYREPAGVQIGDTVYLCYQNHSYLYLRKGDISGFLQEEIIDSSDFNIKRPKLVSGNSKIGIFYYTYPADSIFFLAGPIPLATVTKKSITVGREPCAITCADTIFLCWKDTSKPPLISIRFMKSTNFGEAWSTPLYLAEDLNTIGKISLAKSNSRVMVAWESEGKIYFRSSDNNGDNFAGLDSLNKEFVYVPTLANTGAGIAKFYCERGDTNTDGYWPQHPDYPHPRHGTKMLGLVAGYSRNNYLGVASGAQFLVAKTENPCPTYEFPVEEDTWVAGLEWLESKGADIVSSSLGYTDWYDWPADYDGRTSPASIAGSEAAKRGVVVVTASGNISVGKQAQIVIPGDAEGIITVGGIDTLFAHWKGEKVFSGYYPTPDHTVKKPEIVSLSAAPVVVNPDSATSYLYSFGTSGATAIVSGICALLLEAHPNWTVDSVRKALFETASHAHAPSDSMGYGWPDAHKAIYYSPPDTAILPGCAFLTPYPNPFILSQSNSIFLPFKLGQGTFVEFQIYSVSGRLIIKEERAEFLMPGQYTDTDPSSPNAAFIWDGKDDKGNFVPSGLYFCVLYTYGAGNDITKIAVIK